MHSNSALDEQTRLAYRHEMVDISHELCNDLLADKRKAGSWHVVVVVVVRQLALSWETAVAPGS